MKLCFTIYDKDQSGFLDHEQCFAMAESILGMINHFARYVSRRSNN